MTRQMHWAFRMKHPDALRLEQELTIRGSAFWAANLLTGGFNLLPVPPLDGAQLASCLREMRRAGKKFKGND